MMLVLLLVTPFMLSLCLVPQSEIENIGANETIHSHPELFKITCNINIKRFTELLQDHPSVAMVKMIHITPLSRQPVQDA